MPIDLHNLLIQISNDPFDQTSYKAVDWRAYQFLSDLGLISVSYGFSTITPLGCLFVKNHSNRVNGGAR